jgi:hypothetical protein
MKDNIMKNKRLLIASLVFISLYASSVFANEEEQDRLYVKADFGSTTFQGFESTGVTVSSESKVGNLVAVGVGLQISPILAFELTYNQFGKQSGSSSVPASSSFESEVSSNALSVVPMFPLGDKTNLFVEVGQHIWKSDTRIGAASSSSDGSDLFYGFGFTYDVRDQIRTGFEFSRYNIDSDNFKTTSVSLAYLF